MSDEPTPDTPEDAPEPDEPDTPWESDDDFDPKRAARLIENLRGDVASLKDDRDTYKAKAAEYEDAQKTEQQRAAEAREKAEAAAAEARTDAAKWQAIAKYGLDPDDADLLGTGTPEDIDARAKRLADRLAPPEDDTPSVRRRPKERLRPGAAPDAEPEETDPRKLAARLPRR